MSRTPFIAANWKMHKTVLEAVAFIKEFRSMANDVFDVEIVVAPPFTALRPVVEAAHASNIADAGQNVHWDREGWDIGTGRNATPGQAGGAHGHIRARLRQWFGGAAADQCHIIYGGSVKPDNVRELASLADVDGALVGGASLDVRGFFEIVSRSRPAGAGA